MKKLTILIGLLALPLSLLGLLRAVATAAPGDDDPPYNSTDAQTPCLGANLLENPSFEGDYSAYIPPEGHPDCPAGICQTAQMAEGWTPWWRSHDPDDLPYIIRMPEYKPAFLNLDSLPIRVRTGGRAQQYFSFFSTHEAGFYQQVPAVEGETYCFSIWGHTWSAEDDGDALTGPEPGELMQKIGIDPTGGTDWQSPEIIWSEARIQADIYDLFSITTTAEAETITVFTYSQPRYGVKHNDVYWDDALVMLVQDFSGIAFTVTPTQGWDILTTPAETVRITQTLATDAEGAAGVTWTAAFTPTGTFTPTLSATAGAAGEPLSVTLDTAGLPFGVYTTTLVIASDPALEGSPVVIPYTVVVAATLDRFYLPLIAR